MFSSISTLVRTLYKFIVTKHDIPFCALIAWEALMEPWVCARPAWRFLVYCLLSTGVSQLSPLNLVAFNLEPLNMFFLFETYHFYN
jgi:hypothetical protein